MKQLIKRYQFFFIVIAANLLLLIFKPEVGMKSFAKSSGSLTEMMLLIPPIFVLIGLFDTWVRQETMIRLMGEDSGLLGVIIAFLLGSFAAGPLYVAFPVAGILLKKGCRFANIIIFIGAWSATKIPISLFEGSVMGWRFMITRYLIDIPVIILIAYVTDKIVSRQEKEMIYFKAMKLG